VHWPTPNLEWGRGCREPYLIPVLIFHQGGLCQIEEAISAIKYTVHEHIGLHMHICVNNNSMCFQLSAHKLNPTKHSMYATAYTLNSITLEITLRDFQKNFNEA
jgi:hypothetical protein